jgi:hypothetical protein
MFIERRAVVRVTFVGRVMKMTGVDILRGGVSGASKRLGCHCPLYEGIEGERMYISTHS